MFPDIDTAKYLVKIAGTVGELTEVQKFRYAIFSSEAALRNETGLDSDYYDSFCDHLMVIDKTKDMLVGAYRLHPGSRLETSQGFYCEKEFELGHFPFRRERVLGINPGYLKRFRRQLRQIFDPQRV